MPARHCDRIKLNVPVEVVLQDESERRTVTANTVDASAFGAQLRDFHGHVIVGQSVAVTFGSRCGNFRVAWVGKAGSPMQNHIGIEALDSNINFWGIEFQDSQTTLEPDFLLFPWEIDRAS
jgi:hypothetical protein